VYRGTADGDDLLDHEADDSGGGPGVLLLLHCGGQGGALPQQVLILAHPSFSSLNGQ
jgi:hypothetical protein